MKVRFWGVRGSFPVPGPTTTRYGGNTSCVQVEAPELEPIVIDAGTGIRHLGKALARRDEFAGGRGVAHLLISHTHWDHIQGLPFFSPLYTEGNQVQIYARERDTHLAAIFASQNQDPYFPVPLSSMRATAEFHDLAEDQEFSVGRAKIRCTRLNHPWIAIAYRVEIDGKSMVYASDTAPFTDILLEQEFIATPPVIGAPLSARDEKILRGMRERLVELCRGVDLLIYDTQFTTTEYQQKPHWGHSTPDDAIALARDAGVGTVCLYHHDPSRTDEAQDEIFATYKQALAGESVQLICASEGMAFDLGAAP